MKCFYTYRCVFICFIWVGCSTKPPMSKKTKKYACRCDSQKQAGHQAVGADQSGSKPVGRQTLRGHEIPQCQRQSTGLRKQIQVPKRIKPWWFASESDKVCVAIKYGSCTIEPAKGKSSVEVASAEELVKALTAIKAAVQAGELDAQIELASSAIKAGFRKRGG